MSVEKHNKSVEIKKHAGGRPRKYKSPKEMQVAIDKYFKDNDKFTICGLALALGFCTRKSLIDCEHYGKEFLATIKNAKLKVENGYEQELRSNHVAGAIFALKNFDWRDRQEQIHGITDGLASLMKEIGGNGVGLPIKEK